jgi:hypothetical protein
MAAELTEVSYNAQPVIPVMIRVTRAASGDWIVLSGLKGVIPIGSMGTSVVTSLQEIAFTYGVATVTPTCTATTAEFAVGTSTITRVPPYYVATAGGEILEVISETAADNATSTWTVRRGCLGTTASATGLAATNVVSILNILFLGGNNVGNDMIVALPLSYDPGSSGFGTAKR